MLSSKIIAPVLAFAFALSAAPVLGQPGKLAPAGGGRTPAKPGDTCLGISACNTLIVECVQSGYDFKPMQSGPKGEPMYGQCVKRTD